MELRGLFLGDDEEVEGVFLGLLMLALVRGDFVGLVGALRRGDFMGLCWATMPLTSTLGDDDVGLFLCRLGDFVGLCGGVRFWFWQWELLSASGCDKLSTSS